MSTPNPAKSALRHRLQAARRATPPEVRRAEAAALAAVLAAAALPGLPGTVCAYWPVGTEPGSPELLDGLRSRGCRVLLPVLAAAAVPSRAALDRASLDRASLDRLPQERAPIDRSPLDWAEYTGAGSLQAGPLGLREPSGQRLGCAALSEAVLVLVPALAVDHRGVRLGRGGGYYDRTLPLARPGTALVAVVRDDEVVPVLPAEPHDVLVHAALTPSGLIPLPVRQ